MCVSQTPDGQYVSPVQITGGGQTFSDPGVRGFSAGGRIGVDVPLSGGYGANVGASGSMNHTKIRQPDFRNNSTRFSFNGADAALIMPDQSQVGFEYGRSPKRDDPGRSDRTFMLRYTKPF